MDSQNSVLKQSKRKKLIIIYMFIALGIFSAIFSATNGSVKFETRDILRAIFLREKGEAYLIIWSARLPRIIGGGLVGLCLAVSGCLLQGVMRNDLASPSTIGVTSGASFVGYLTLVAFPQFYFLLPVGSIVGALLTTLLIYFISYQEGVSPVRMILSGMAISAVFSAFINIIRSFFPDRIENAIGFLMGSLNGVTFDSINFALPYIIVGLIISVLVASKMNLLLLGDEVSNSLGLRTELFRFIVIVVSSILAGSAISIAGLINFVGLIVPHMARLLVGSDYRYLLPASMAMGFSLVILADLIGRLVLPIGEISVSVIISFIGAPFFLYLLRKKRRN